MASVWAITPQGREEHSRGSASPPRKRRTRRSPRTLIGNFRSPERGETNALTPTVWFRILSPLRGCGVFGGAVRGLHPRLCSARPCGAESPSPPELNSLNTQISTLLMELAPAPGRRCRFAWMSRTAWIRPWSRLALRKRLLRRSQSRTWPPCRWGRFRSSWRP